MELQNLEVGAGLSMSLTQLFSHRVFYTVSCPSSQLVAFRSVSCSTALPSEEE